jgi:hypothetical protein
VKIPSLLLLSAALSGTAGCAQGGSAIGPDAPLPTAVTCADASKLKDQAADARRRIRELGGDRAQIIGGNRAKFLGSLALLAQLKCKANVSEVDALLGEALEVGHVAETTTSEYEAARQWTEADLIIGDAVALLVSQLSAPVSR